MPLADKAIGLLRHLYTEAGSEFVFIGSRAGMPLSNSAMSVALKRLGRSETIHGFRSSFRTWAAERTNYPREVAEQALAHTIGDPTERAYARTSLFDHRRRLMADWATYCCAPTGRARLWR